jgi:threonine/homoserine/homoserine lactone efflux protein
MANLYPFLAYVFVTTFTPGPNNILSMSHAVQSGYKKTLPFLAGIFSGFVVVMLLCGLLNFALANLLPQVRPWLNLLGAAYMVYLAIHIALSKPAAADAAPRGLNSYWAGFNLQFLNLKVILYGVTVFSNFIIQAYSSPLALGLFSIGLAAIGFVSISCWAFGGEVLRSFLKTYQRAFNLAMAALLVYTAVASLIH